MGRAQPTGISVLAQAVSQPYEIQNNIVHVMGLHFLAMTTTTTTVTSTTDTPATNPAFSRNHTLE